MNEGWIYRERVGKTDAGLSLLDYYTQKYPHSNQWEWLERIKSEQILVDGQVQSAQTILKIGQQLTYHRPPWEEPIVPLSFDVLYEDDDVLVVAKPSLLPVLPGAGFLHHTLLWQLQQKYPNRTPIPIHRLGRGTSGLVLLARSPLARANLSEQMRSRQIEKIYRALVGSGDFPEHFAITHPIGKISHPSLGYIFAATSDGLFAHSECRVLTRNPNTTVVEVKILTGRPHQIRVHLAVAGYPLIGDPLYTIGGIPRIEQVSEGQKLPVPGDCGYHLHAYRLSFLHPLTNKLITLTCSPPSILS